MRKSLTILTCLTILGAGAFASGHLALPSKAGVEKIQLAAAQQTATFKIENMTCASCPITVRIAMQRVAGVASVKIDFEAKTALVVFDPAKTDVGTIAAASTNAGYPAATVQIKTKGS